MEPATAPRQGADSIPGDLSAEERQHGAGAEVEPSGTTRALEPFQIRLAGGAPGCEVGVFFWGVGWFPLGS